MDHIARKKTFSANFFYVNEIINLNKAFQLYVSSYQQWLSDFAAHLENKLVIDCNISYSRPHCGIHFTSAVLVIFCWLYFFDFAEMLNRALQETNMQFVVNKVSSWWTKIDLDEVDFLKWKPGEIHHICFIL